MKHLLSFALALCTSALLAQVPNSFNYQSIVRDGFGALVGSQQLGVKVSIVKDSLGGNVQYSETHSPTTNSNGLFSIQIGEGNATTGVFDSIGWESGGLYYQVEVDMQGGTNYALNSFQPFTSVAYAKVAERALNVDDADADPTNELQQISLSGDTLSLSNGGSVVMPNSTSNSQSRSTTEIRFFTQHSSESPTSLEYVAAIKYCAQLTENGFSDWALATYDEIVWYMERNPTFPPAQTETWTKPLGFPISDRIFFAMILQGDSLTGNGEEGFKPKYARPSSSQPNSKCVCFR